MSDELKMVMIEWSDSASAKEDVWLAYRHLITDYSKIKSVGFIVHEADDRITIMGHLADCGKDGPESAKGGITIPKCCITARYDLSASVTVTIVGGK